MRVRWIREYLVLASIWGCAADMATDEDMAGDDASSDVVEIGGSEQALSTAVNESFESTALGPLGAPWFVSTSPAHASTANVVTSDASHGRVLAVRGSATLGEFLIAALGFSAAGPNSDVSFDIRPASGASFVFAFNGSGSSIGARRIRLQRAPGSNTLVAATNFGSVPCATLASDAWTRVRLRVRTESFPHTFDVLLNGVATACISTPTGLGTPYSGLNVMDASNEGWGGQVLLDNVLVRTGTFAELP